MEDAVSSTIDSQPDMLLWYLNATPPQPRSMVLRRELNGLLHLPPMNDDVAVDEATVMARDGLLEGLRHLGTLVKRYVDLREWVEKIEEDIEVVRTRCLSMRTDVELLQHRVQQQIDRRRPPTGGSELDSAVSNLMSFMAVTEDLMTGMLSRTLEDARHLYATAHRQLHLFSDVYRAARASWPSYACPICMSDCVDVYISPCGHTYCSKCAPPSSERCYICRMHVARVHDLFFST
jgi:hypothetical protein